MTGFYSAVGGLVVILGLVAWLYWQIKRDGKTEEKLREEESDADAARRISDIISRSPRTPEELQDRLRKGGGL